MTVCNDTCKSTPLLAAKGCDAPGCINPHHAKGYCAMHWERLKRTGECGDNAPKIIRHTSTHCSVDGCDLRPHAHGMCGMHNNRMRRYGRIDLVMRTFSQAYFETCFDRHESGCWLWNMGLIDTGYAQFFSKLAHRVSYAFYKGQIPLGKVVMHSCDVRHCVNPAHLNVGTHKDNTADMMTKQRHRVATPRFGLDNPLCKFTANDVARIRELHVSGKSAREIGKMFSVHHGTISKYVKLDGRG